MSQNVYEKALKSKTFCILPFIHFKTEDGNIKLCCRSETISSLKNSVIDIWNSDRYKQIRLQLLNSERPEECESCWSNEKIGVRSSRNIRMDNWDRKALGFLKQVHNDGHVPFLPTYIELKLSNLCNLKCRMCNPIDSTSWIGDYPLVSDLMKKHHREVYEKTREQKILKKKLVSDFIENEQWWDDFEKIKNTVKTLKILGGEPLTDPIHYRILDLLKFRSSEIHLTYDTNLTHLKFKNISILDYWKIFKKVSVCASIDGLYDVYDYIRTGSNFNKVIKNLHQVIKSQSVHTTEVVCTVQIYNVFQLSAIMDYFSKKGIHLYFLWVKSPKLLNIQVLPENLKNLAVKSILEYRKKINMKNPYDKDITENLNNYIEDFINYINGKDLSHFLPDFLDYTKKLDRARGTNVLHITPELKELFNAK